MIAFVCSSCGLKFSVKPEFAGRSTRCPTCKQQLTVPVPATGRTLKRKLVLVAVLAAAAGALALALVVAGGLVFFLA